PPDPVRGDADLLRSDILQLLDDLHLKYAVTPVREKLRNEIGRSIGIVMGLMLLVILAMVLTIAVLNHWGISPGIAMGVSRATLFWSSALVGGGAAFTSPQQRTQSIPASGDAILNVLAIHNGKFSIFLAPLSGAIFAVLAYLLFAGNMVQGDFF